MAALEEKIVSIGVPPKGKRQSLCTACRMAVRLEAELVLHLDGVIVQGGLAHLDVSTHPYMRKTACGEVFANDELTSC